MDPDLQESLRGLVAGAPPEILAVYLYGSRARGTASPGSDLDLGVLLGATPSATLLDVASHVVSDERLGEPETNRALFDLLVKGGRLSPALAATLRDMAGFRNVIVHGYQDVDLGVVEDVLRNHLDDLLAFVSAIRGR